MGSETAVSVLLLLLACSLTSANFLNEPSIQWSYSLPVKENGDPQRLGKGNAVVSTNDDGTLFITTQDASVFMLQTSDGLPVSDAYQPPVLPDTTSSCQSGISLVEDASGVQYAVYAVLDTPNDNDEPISSRIIALNPDGSERWIVPLDGSVVGTPQIGADGDVVYISHNVPNQEQEDDEGERSRGQLTLVRDNGGTPVVVSQVSPQDRFGPFGPLTVKTSEASEVVFVAERWGGGYSYSGNVYYLAAAGGVYSLELFSEWGYSSAAAPAVSNDGTDMLWMAGVGSTVGGWVDEAYSFGLSVDERPSDPTWQSSFLQDGEFNTTLEVSPVVSTDNTKLFISGASDEVYCVEAESGRLQWAHDGGTSVKYIAEPVFRNPNGDDGVLYTISIPAGKVQQVDVRRGRQNWGHDCEDLTRNNGCENGVEAEFSVSQSDNTLYYGNVDGVIVSLQVGTFATEAPVATPTAMPTGTEPLAPDTSPGPTATATVAPTASPTERAFVPPNDDPANVNTSAQAPSGPSDTTTKALFAISALIVVIAVGILAYVFMSIRRRRQRKHATLPVAIDKDLDGEADTGIAIESSLDTFRDVKKKNKKKKSLNTSLSSEGSSPSRLHSIAESSVEDSSVDESVDLMQDDEEDIDSYVFDYVAATPDTSMSSTPSVSPEKATKPGIVGTAAAAAALALKINQSSSSTKESEGAPTPDNEEVVQKNNDSMADGQLVPTDSNVARPYYMIDTRTGAAGSIIEVGGTQTDDESIEVTAENVPLPEKSNATVSAPEGDEQVAVSSSMVPVNTGSRSAYAMDPGTPGTDLKHGEHADEATDLVPVALDLNRSSTYAMEPSSQTGAIAVTLERSDASSVYVEEKKDTSMGNGNTSLASIDEGAVPANQQTAMVPVSASKERSSYAMELEKTPSNYFDDQSTVTSMYLDDESTLATAKTGDGTVETAPLDERAARLRSTRPKPSPTAVRRDVSLIDGTTSALSPTPPRKGRGTGSASPSPRLDAISPLTVEKGESLQDKKRSPSYSFKTPMSPGSTIESTSVYVDDDGSVEVEPETNANIPLDERPTPPSVKLNAIAPVPQNSDGSSQPLNGVKTRSLRKTYNKTNTPSPVVKKVSRTSLASSGPKLSPPPPLSPTSTCTNESQSSVESGNNSGLSQDVNVRGSARSMRKMRLEQMRQERTLRGWKDSPRSSSTNERTASTSKAQMVSSRSNKPSIIATKKATSGSVTTGSSQSRPMSDVAVVSRTLDVSPDSVSSQDIFPSDTDSSAEQRPPPAPTAMRSNQPRRSKSQGSSSRLQPARRSTSSSSDNNRQQPPKKISVPSRSSSRGRSSRSRSASSSARKKQVESYDREKQVEKAKEEARPAAITSYFSGLMKHVEEAERQFFNPTLSASNKRGSNTSGPNGSTTHNRSNVYAPPVSDDDESLPPPPPSMY